MGSRWSRRTCGNHSDSHTVGRELVLSLLFMRTKVRMTYLFSYTHEIPWWCARNYPEEVLNSPLFQSDINSFTVIVWKSQNTLLASRDTTPPKCNASHFRSKGRPRKVSASDLKCYLRSGRARPYLAPFHPKFFFTFANNHVVNNFLLGSIPPQFEISHTLTCCCWFKPGTRFHAKSEESQDD